MSARLAVEALVREHRIDDFDCGNEALNRFLIRHALQNQQMGASRTYVAIRSGEILGFYALVFGQVEFSDAPERLRKGVAQHPVPLMVLARLGVSRDAAGQGLGGGLLKDAMRRTLQAAEIAGIRALAVHAKDAAARSFYEHFDFVASPSDPMHLFVLLKDVRAILS